MMKRTISKSAVEKIRAIPKESKCLVANINSFMANETLATIYQLGFKNIFLKPFYPELEDFPNKSDYIPAHEEYDYIKKTSGKLVIIGNRIFDINTILDILSILDVDSKTSEKIILEYLDLYIELNLTRIFSPGCWWECSILFPEYYQKYFLIPF